MSRFTRTLLAALALLMLSATPASAGFSIANNFKGDAQPTKSFSDPGTWNIIEGGGGGGDL